MSTTEILRTHNLDAGILRVHAKGRGFVFYASNSAFDIVHGATFANRHAAQRAVDRVAVTQGLGGVGHRDSREDFEDRAIRNAMV